MLRKVGVHVFGVFGFPSIIKSRVYHMDLFYNNALIDLTTLQLANDVAEGYSPTNFRPSLEQSPHQVLSTMERIVGKNAARNAVGFLERLVVCDHMYFDQYAAELISFEVAQYFREFISELDCPAHVYSSSQVAAAARHRVLSRKIDREDLNKVEQAVLDDDKPLHDQYYDSSEFLLCFANSNQGLLRALFYMEMADFSRLPVFLSEQKSAILGLFDITTLDPHKCVVDRTDEAIRNGYNPSELQLLSLDIPPVFEMIVGTAKQNKSNLLESALRIRESREARAYRLNLAQLFYYVGLGRGGLLKVQQILSEVTKASEEMRDEYRAMERSEGRYLKYKMAQIPSMARLLKSTGYPKGLLPYDVLDRPDAYICFVAEWYKQ